MLFIFTIYKHFKVKEILDAAISNENDFQGIYLFINSVDIEPIYANLFISY